MAAGLVSQHQQSAFAAPLNGDAGDATVVLGNDNATVSTYDAHDADATIHVQSSSAAVFNATPAGVVGRKWMTTDTGGVYLYYDTGSAWVEVNYQRVAATGAVTITSTTVPQLTVAYDGSHHATFGVASTGALAITQAVAVAINTPLASIGNASAQHAWFSSAKAVEFGTDAGIEYISGNAFISMMAGIYDNASGQDTYAVSGFGVTVYAQSGGTHSFQTAASGTAGAAATLVERLLITNAGNVVVSTGLLTFGGVTNSFPAIKRSSASLHFKLADDSAFTAVAMDNIVLTGTAQSNGGTVSMGAVTRTTIGANGAATALTAAPLGYLDVYIGTTAAQIPYYNRGA